MKGGATNLRIAFGLGLAALAAPAAGGSLDGLPGLEVEYYDVSGRTAAEIRASLDRLRPTDPATGEHVDAYTRWYLSWSVPGGPNGECLLDEAEVEVEVTVGLPRLVDTATVPPAVLYRWQQYMAALEAHEGAHIRDVYRGRDEMLDAIQGSECADASAAARAVMEDVSRRNAEYDRATHHGQTEGARFP